MNPGGSSGSAAFALIYFTFFLDNVLLTVLVPIIPDWVGGGAALAQWARHRAPFAALLNGTVRLRARAGGESDDGDDGLGSGAAQAVVGLVLGAKAAAQLAAAGPAAAAVGRCGPARVLRAASLLLASAAAAYWAAAGLAGARAAGAVAAGRALHGAGAAAASVAGLALAARALPPARAPRAMGALLGAVALGVLVGYPCGGMTDALWNRGLPFLVIAAALLLNFALQYVYLNKDEYNQGSGAADARRGWCARGLRGAGGACCGAVGLSTSVMAALEPTVPPWLARCGAPPAAAGLVFLPDSAAYFVAASLLGDVAARLGAERVAIAGVAGVGVAALGAAGARSLGALAAPHALLGAALGAVDAALVPALLARRRHRVAATAALLQTASAGAYALGPVCGGALAAAAGFPTALRALGAANLLYCGFLYRALARHPLSTQWGAPPPGEDSSDSDSESEAAGAAPPGRTPPGRAPPASAPLARVFAPTYTTIPPLP